MEEVFIIAVDSIFGGVVLWIASKVTVVDLLLKETIIAASAAALVSQLPVAGWLLSIAILFYLLKKFSNAAIWPDIIVLILVSRLVSFAAVMALGGF